MSSSVGSSAHQDQSRLIDPLKLKSKARLQLELAASGLPQKALAYGIRTSEAQMSRYLGDQSPDDLPSYKVPYLTTELGPGYMEWLAIQCGGVYHHGKQGHISHESVTTLIGLLAKQSGNVVQQLLQHLEDHIWSEKERLEDLPSLRKLQAIIQSLVQDAEGGAQ
jgi:hypothetical protein